MRAYRITKKKYVNNFNGRGASYKDGARWNLPGQPVLYFGTSASVAMLEMGHYIPTLKMVPKSFVLGIYDIDSTAIESVELTELADEWGKFPYPLATQRIGSDFLDRGDNLILLVPSSAAAGIDKMIVVNPEHPDINKISLIETRSEIFNPRLFKGL